VFDKLKHIATGWAKYAGLMATSEQEKALSIARMEVCGTCEFAKESKALEFISGGAQSIDTLYCSQCYCPCHQKSLTDDLCPLGRWEHLKQLNTAI
jgi:hypothetical protein